MENQFKGLRQRINTSMKVIVLRMEDLESVRGIFLKYLDGQDKLTLNNRSMFFLSPFEFIGQSSQFA